MSKKLSRSILSLLCCLSSCSLSCAQQEDELNASHDVEIVKYPSDLAPSKISGLLSDGQYSGSLVCSVNNANYTSKGLEWPWENILQIYSIRKGQVKENFYSVSRKKYDFAFYPRWLKPGKIAFKVGDPIGSYGTYDLAIWNSSDNSVQVAQRNLFLRSFSASQDSRFIAFVEGGLTLPFGAPVDPQSLTVFDSQNKTSRALTSSVPDLSGQGWTLQNKLLYTERRIRPEEQVQGAPIAKSSIGEFDPASGKSQLFRFNAFTPFVSPDGKWIAYFSFDDPFPEEKATKMTKTIVPDPTLSAPVSPIYLVIADPKGVPVSLITEKNWDYLPILRWSADSKKVIVYERRTRKVSAESREMEGNVSSYDLESKELKKIGNLRYFAPTGMEMNDDELLCRPINLTKDGRFLLFELQSSTPPAGTTLAAFDLSNGTTQTWFSISAFQGLDWIED